MSLVRTRFAPSPTGYMHIGNLRTALYAYLIAKGSDGVFILRLEDTDQDRYVEEAVDFIYKTMRLTGLEYDEGPDVGGDFGPYIQSERRAIYKKYAVELINKDAAYPCFCSQERLAELREESRIRKEPYKYDRYCLGIAKEEAMKRMSDGEEYVIRQKMPQTGTTTFKDAVFDDITVDNNTLEDQILLKSDGLPTYNFANVVDDHLMKISHVVRGTEYLSSAPKYNLLYEAFGWQIPTYVHLPPIMKDEGKKLSKREGDASFDDFYSKGYLKEAIINYIALLGWSPGNEKEIFTLKELKEAFDIKGISKSPAIFDPMKLKWMNGMYIRQLSSAEFHEKALPWISQVLDIDKFDTLKISDLLQSRTEILNEIPEMIDFLAALPEYDLNLFVHKKMKTTLELSISSLQSAHTALTGVETWEHDDIYGALKGLAKQQKLKTGQIFWPVRVAITGKEFTPGGAIGIAEVLGKSETLNRIQTSIQKLENHI